MRLKYLFSKEFLRWNQKLRWNVLFEAALSQTPRHPQDLTSFLFAIWSAPGKINFASPLLFPTSKKTLCKVLSTVLASQSSSGFSHSHASTSSPQALLWHTPLLCFAWLGISYNPRDISIAMCAFRSIKKWNSPCSPLNMLLLNEFYCVCSAIIYASNMDIS